MDPENERKIFKLIVQSACHDDTAQYLMFSPKVCSQTLTLSDLFNSLISSRLNERISILLTAACLIDL